MLDDSGDVMRVEIFVRSLDDSEDVIEAIERSTTDRRADGVYIARGYYSGERRFFIETLNI